MPSPARGEGTFTRTALVARGSS
ncbi:hypothetical protein BRAO375_670007 [Bradyrhizobium sp. ORS 375]|nr:hypothetical protein BRAO375_670007 [Bradyrhizobium sp. ORS 375]